MTRDDIVAAARSYIDVPWRDEGRNRAGLDCAGLLCCVGKDLGVKFDDMLGYRDAINSTAYMKHLMTYLTVNKSGLLLPGSVGLFAQSRFPCHVGIFASLDGEQTIINANVYRRRVVEESTSSLSNLRLVMVLDFRGVTD